MKRLPTMVAALLGCWVLAGMGGPVALVPDVAAAIVSPAPAATDRASASTSLRPLDARGVAALTAPPAHGARLLALWALDCAYCEPNLAALAALQHAHPGDFELVTVATDPVTARAAIMARLRQAGVANYPAYAYAEAAPERLNFLIDPKWGGETPRVLLIRADGSRLGISGELTPAQLKKLR